MVSAHGDMAQVIGAVEKAVRRARSADRVLAALAEVLGQRFDLCRISLRAIAPDAPAEVVVQALWTRGQSDLAPGVRMPLRSTTLEQVVATGRPEIGLDVKPEDGLLHQILAGEGIRSYASVPLGDTARGEPVLSLSSSRPHAFGESETPLVEAVASVVATRLSAISRL